VFRAITSAHVQKKLPTFFSKRHCDGLNIEQVTVYLERNLDSTFAQPEFKGPYRDVNASSVPTPPTPFSHWWRCFGLYDAIKLQFEFDDAKGRTFPCKQDLARGYRPLTTLFMGSA
jgi:hypothetical protein